MGKIVWILISVLVFLGLVFGFLYYKAGLKEHLELYRYWNSLENPEEKISKKDLYFLNSDINADGGTLAWVTSKGVYLWNDGSIKYYQIDNNTQLLSFDNCNATATDSVNTDIPIDLLKRYSNSLKDWNTQVKTGDQVFVSYNKELRVPIAKALYSNPDFNLSTYILCFAKITNE